MGQASWIVSDLRTAGLCPIGSAGSGFRASRVPTRRFGVTASIFSTTGPPLIGQSVSAHWLARKDVRLEGNERARNIPAVSQISLGNRHKVARAGRHIAATIGRGVRYRFRLPGDYGRTHDEVFLPSDMLQEGCVLPTTT